MAITTQNRRQAPVTAKRRARVDHVDSGHVDEDVLTLAITWLPYGGAPAEDIWIKFGLTPDGYAQRLRDVVERHRARIHPVTVHRLLSTE